LMRDDPRSAMRREIFVDLDPGPLCDSGHGRRNPSAIEWLRNICEESCARTKARRDSGGLRLGSTHWLFEFSICRSVSLWCCWR